MENRIKCLEDDTSDLKATVAEFKADFKHIAGTLDKIEATMEKMLELQTDNKILNERLNTQSERQNAIVADNDRVHEVLFKKLNSLEKEQERKIKEDLATCSAPIKEEVDEIKDDLRWIKRTGWSFIGTIVLGLLAFLGSKLAFE